MNNKFLDRAYRIRLYPIDEEFDETQWVAEIPDLPGCIGAGDTAEEAMQMVLDAKKAWINNAIKKGKKIPEPLNSYKDDYSGKFTLRLPKSLHKELTIRAEEEGVSLNQLILYLISRNVSNESFGNEITATLEDCKTDNFNTDIKVYSRNTRDNWGNYGYRYDFFEEVNLRNQREVKHGQN